MGIKTISAWALVLSVLSAGDGSVSLKFGGKEGLIREYSYTNTGSSFETTGRKKLSQQRKTAAKMIERVLSVNKDGSMDVEVDFEKPTAYLSKKKLPPPFLPALSFTRTPAGRYADVRPVNPFDVRPGMMLPPYREFLGLVEFPKTPVSVGDTWQYESKVLFPFGVFQNALVTATFERWGDYKGKKCAVITTRCTTSVADAPSPLGIIVDGMASRDFRTCVSLGNGGILSSTGTTTSSVISSQRSTAAPGGAPLRVFMRLSETYTTSLLKERME